HAGLTTLIAFAEYNDGETLPQATKRIADEASQTPGLDFGFHFILNNEPQLLEGLAEAFEMGVTSYKIFMTYKKRPKRMCTDDFIAQVMERLPAPGGICQLHLENRAIRIGAMTGCPVYVVHLSTAGGLERIKDAQAEGQRVWTETCPQYLLLT